MTEDPDALVRLAQTGDEEMFARLTQAYRRELLVHCYRMLGSLQDAEDVVQEVFLRAWRRWATFRRPGSFRAWLYKIATNACLDALKSRPRRALPPAVYPAADPLQSVAAPIAEPMWLEPLPEEWLPDTRDNPEARYTTQESVTLAFLVLLHALAPRQRAVLVLRDVLNWRASEVAAALGMSLSAVNSALHRARVTMAKHPRPAGYGNAPLPAADSRVRGLLDAYVHAWEAADVTRLVALLRDDAAWIMPPIPTWYRGREAIGTFLATQALASSGHGIGARYLPIRANGQPAVAIYSRPDPSGVQHALGLHVLTLDDSRRQIASVTAFLEPKLFAHFGLASELPA